jgi:hypothetical protein
VVRAIEDENNTMCELNVYMRVQASSVCAFETLDFRTLLDRCAKPTAVLCVRRAGDSEETTVRVPLSASRIGTRELFVDSEPVPYLIMGGLVIVMLSKSHMHDDNHDFPADGAIRRALRDPDVTLRSRPMISYVLAGSPFAKHGASKLQRSLVTAVNGAPMHTLESVWREYQAPCSHIVLTLDNGAKVGALHSELEAYDKTSDPLAGVHTADRRRHGTRARKRVRFQEE